MKYLLLFLAILLLIFSPWFDFGKTLSGGDWPYLFKENIQEFGILKQPLLWLDPYYRITAIIGVLLFSIPWEVTEKIFWFFPFLIISLFSSWQLVKFFFGNFYLSIIGSLIFTTNTYILMIVGGGQLGVAMAYAFTPLVLHRFFILINNPKYNLKHLLLASVVSAFQIMFDPRIFLLTFFILSGYVIFNLFFSKINLLKISKEIILATVLSIILNLFWIIPLILGKGEEYVDIVAIGNVSYFSFAKMEDAVSLLHPNWPENLFGKVYFMRPEFIILPIIAYASLLFSVNKKQSNILYFALTGIIGAFLAKGTNPPFGEIYTWLSSYSVFMAFRDPTKWYLPVVIAYSIIIPFTLLKISEAINLKFPKINKNITFLSVFLLFFAYWLFLIQPAWKGELAGTFKTKNVPTEYIELKDFVREQPDFFRVLWVPQKQRFGFYSEAHPYVDNLTMDEKIIFSQLGLTGFLDKLKQQGTKKWLQDQKIKYVILPFDSEGEIFLEDRKYDVTKRKKAEEALNSLPWLKKIKSFGAAKTIVIYEVSR